MKTISKRSLKLTGDSPRVRRRQLIEQTIAAAVVEEALRQGYYITVDNGDYGEKTPSEQTKTALLKLMFETDEETLFLHKNGAFAGAVFLVYGNDGWDVISDYHVSIEAVANSPRVFELIEKFEQEG